MVQLFIIADDFTGALDTGVKLAGLGAKTRVVTALPEDPAAWTGDVLVWDSETRHMRPEDAYTTIRSTAQRLGQLPNCYIFKKTDSALRGNIGAELQGLLDGLGLNRIAFLPAYPELNRVTRRGVQYIDGVPVSESIFGTDLLNPVRHASVAGIIAEQSRLPVWSKGSQEARMTEDGVTVFDTETRQEMDNLFAALKDQGVRIFAGCAGAGACLPQLLSADQAASAVPALNLPFFVLCGSINPVTAVQLEHAANKGFRRFRLAPEQTLSEGFWESPEAEALLQEIRTELEARHSVIADAMDALPGQTLALAHQLGMSMETVRTRISHVLAELFHQLFTQSRMGTVILIGGDTLQDCMRSLGIREMEPIVELVSGVVLARFSWEGRSRYVLTKSGGFGVPTLLTDLVSAAETDNPFTNNPT